MVSAREGYAQWAASYEHTIKEHMDRGVLERVATVAWAGVQRAADLGCGTGRTAAWLKAHGVARVDGIDGSPEMLARARQRGVFDHLAVADVAATGLDTGAYDLVTTSLVDEHLADLRPLYRESARLAQPGGAHVLVGFHPFFIMKTGMPTHFDGPDGTPVAIETHIHLFSEHVAAASVAGWHLAELHEQVIDERWIAKKAKWAAFRDVPVSFAAVWRTCRTADPRSAA